MKATDLMIGNFVSQKHSGIILKVSKIDPPYIEADGEGGRFHEETIDPIQLTEEILEKNEFKRYGQVYANLQQWVGKFGDKRKSFVQDIRTGEWGMNDVWINYVHELQNILKLCGINKTIEL